MQNFIDSSTRLITVGAVKTIFLKPCCGQLYLSKKKNTIITHVLSLLFVYLLLDAVHLYQTHLRADSIYIIIQYIEINQLNSNDIFFLRLLSLSLVLCGISLLLVFFCDFFFPLVHQT